MHVAHFLHRYPPALGGAEAYFARLGRSLAERGDIVTVWTTTALELEAFWKQGFPELAPSRESSPRDERGSNCERDSCQKPHSSRGLDSRQNVIVKRYTPWRWPGRRYLLKALSLVPVRPWQCLTLPCNPFVPGMARDAERYAGPLDVVHASAFPFAFPILCALRLARRRGVPFLLTPFLHLGDPTNPRDRTRRQYTHGPFRWLLRQADTVFVQTASERQAVLDLGVPERRVVLQGLGVEPGECTGGDREAVRQTWGVPASEVVVGHLANASVEKGTVDLLRVAAQAWSAGESFRVVLAGPEMPNFRQFWEAYPHKNCVTRLGVLGDDTKRDFFAGIDLFALPSRTDSFGLVLLEAWANGKPNLVYRAGGPAELVRDGEDGLQAACGNLPELEHQLTRLVRDPELRKWLGHGGQARAEREFRWETKLECVYDVMRELSHRSDILLSRDSESSERSAKARVTRSSPKTPSRG